MNLDPEHLVDAVVIGALAKSLGIAVFLEQSPTGIRFNAAEEIAETHLAVLCAGAGMRHPEDICDTASTKTAFALGKKIAIAIRSRLKPETISGTASMIPAQISLQDAVDRLLDNADLSPLKKALGELLD